MNTSKRHFAGENPSALRHDPVATPTPWHQDSLIAPLRPTRPRHDCRCLQRPANVAAVAGAWLLNSPRPVIRRTLGVLKRPRRVLPPGSRPPFVPSAASADVKCVAVPDRYQKDGCLKTKCTVRQARRWTIFLVCAASEHCFIIVQKTTKETMEVHRVPMNPVRVPHLVDVRGGGVWRPSRSACRVCCVTGRSERAWQASRRVTNASRRTAAVDAGTGLHPR